MFPDALRPMTPRQYLRRYREDERLLTGAYYPNERIIVERGDTVGVVLFHKGDPESADHVRPFLYEVFMDPACFASPGRRSCRAALSRIGAMVWGRALRKQYESVGGASPLASLARDQAASLESRLCAVQGRSLGVRFRVYATMRYGRPDAVDVARRMREDNVTKVVLLPSFPQYSKTTTGSALAHWWHLEQEGIIPGRRTVAVTEYATNDKYIRAIGERIDEALQRFCSQTRTDVPIVFSAQGSRAREFGKKGDPYSDAVQATVAHVMAARSHDRPYIAAFHGGAYPLSWSSAFLEALAGLRRQGHAAVVVAPVTAVAESLDTTYTLDIALRRLAWRTGFRRVEVAPTLNDHSLYIEALADLTRARLTRRPGADAGTTPEAPAHTEQVSL